MPANHQPLLTPLYTRHGQIYQTMKARYSCLSMCIMMMMFINNLTEGLLFALLSLPTLTGTWVRQPHNEKNNNNISGTADFDII